jgi:hypothetical protein
MQHTARSSATPHTPFNHADYGGRETYPGAAPVRFIIEQVRSVRINLPDIMPGQIFALDSPEDHYAPSAFQFIEGRSNPCSTGELRQFALKVLMIAMQCFL